MFIGACRGLLSSADAKADAPVVRKFEASATDTPTAHLLSNGTLADVVLFGAFLVWAIVERISLKRRAPRPLTSAPPAPWNDAIALIGGLALYVVMLLWLHRILIGVALR